MVLILAMGAALVLFNFYTVRERAKEDFAAFDGHPSGQTQLRITTGNTYEPFFREPFEKAVFFFWNGSHIVFTTNNDYFIDAPASAYTDFIRKQGRAVSDVRTVVHNHFTPMSFSPGDERLYEHLKRLGFRGDFLIYHTATGKVESIRDKERGG